MGEGKWLKGTLGTVMERNRCSGEGCGCWNYVCMKSIIKSSETSMKMAKGIFYLKQYSSDSNSISTVCSNRTSVCYS